MDSSKKVKRKQLILVVSVVVSFILVLIFGLWWSDPYKNKLSPIELSKEKAKQVDRNYTAKSSNSVDAQETWISKSEILLKSMKGNTEELKSKTEKENKELRLKLENLENEFLLLKNKTQSNTNIDLNSSLPFPSDVNTKKVYSESEPVLINKSNNSSMLPPPPKEILGKKNLYDNKEPINDDDEKKSGIFAISLVDENSSEIIEEESLKNINTAVPVGSYAIVGLISGMDAPTGSLATKNPVPVLLRVLDKGQLPNFFNSDVANCSVTGAGYGDISSERVYIRTEKISCVLKNGDIAEKDIKGYVTGEDGKAGLRGKLVSKQGSLIAKSFLSGMFSGVGTSIASQYSSVSTSALGAVTTLDSNKAMQSGVATGASTALEKIADWYLDRANETYPIIEIDAKRIGELILTGTVDFKTKLIGETNQR